MGKPYIYTRTFKQLSVFDERFWVRLEANLLTFDKLLETNPIEPTPFADWVWRIPITHESREDLYNIIRGIAKITRVKIMFKLTLGEFEEPAKLFLLIGEQTRIQICNHILNYTIGGIIRYELWVKKYYREIAFAIGYKTIASYVKDKVSQRLFKIEHLPIFFKPIKIGEVYRLENYVMGKYKLNYKYYGQLSHAYYNAISRKFKDRRMML